MKKLRLNIIKNSLELDSAETGYVTIQMPLEEFEFIRNALKL